MIIGYKLKINPFGNTTSGSDEFFPNSKMELFVDGEFPLQFGANDLTIQDTLKIDWFEESAILPANALVYLNYINGFPIGAEAVFYLLDANQMIIDSITGTTPVHSGTYLPDTYLTTPYTGRIDFNVSSSTIDNLANTEQLILRLKFNSDGTENIKISPSTFFDFNLHTNLKIRVTY